MSRPTVDRLKDIVYSSELATRHGDGLDVTALMAADQQRDAALFRIAVVGEAASHLPADVLALAPEIPWNDVKNMRNHIIHGYWQIDFRIVADTIAFDLEPLQVTAKRLIELIERAGP